MLNEVSDEYLILIALSSNRLLLVHLTNSFNFSHPTCSSNLSVSSKVPRSFAFYSQQQISSNQLVNNYSLVSTVDVQCSYFTKSGIHLAKINDLHARLFHGQIDYSNLTMNNATTIGSFFGDPPNSLPLNNTEDDFLIINLNDSNLDKLNPAILDQQFNPNLTAQFIDLNQTNFDLNNTINYNHTSNQPPIIAIHRPLLALFLGKYTLLDENSLQNIDLIVVPLACICIFIVLGNTLIIVAVRKSRQLRQQTTNYFVIALAFSDTLVGLIVMPFSVVQEVMNKVWIFGPDICDIWHALDVWGTTSSILSLCVISIDRYYAITKPLDYAVKMTPKKAKILIVLIFIVSSLLSFPAIFWWRSVSVYKEYECNFPVSTGYIVFSSTLSFYGPLVVMVVAYYRIYRAAVEQTRSLKTGAKTISCASNIYHTGGGHFDNGQFNTKTDYPLPDHMIILRMHRGGNYNSDSISSKYDSNMKIEHANKKQQKPKRPFSLASASTKGRSSTSLDCVDRLASAICNIRGERDQMTTSLKVDLNANTENVKANEDEDEKKQGSFEQSQLTSGSKHQVNNAWSISRKVSKLAKERKAAKTLGIVMGVFIISWSPFFITHIVMGICASNCDINEDAVYSFVTWLGWLNSGMNPIIYVCWSRDFRKAFRKVLCGFRSSSQRSSTGYSSYYFSSKLNAPASSLARKRPLIDRHFDYKNRQSNSKQMTSMKQSNLVSSEQLLDQSVKENQREESGKNHKRSSKVSRSEPTESNSSLNLSNVIRESDSKDNFISKTNGLTNSPFKQIEQQTEAISSNKTINEKQLNEISGLNCLSNNLNNLTILSNSNVGSINLENEDVPRDSNALNHVQFTKNKRLAKVDRIHKSQDSNTDGAKFSLGNWFGLNREHKKQTTKTDSNKTNSQFEIERTNQNYQLYADQKVHRINDEFDRNKAQILSGETNQVKDNNSSFIDQKLEISSASQIDEKNSERYAETVEHQCEKSNNFQIDKSVIDRDQLIAHDPLINESTNDDNNLISSYNHCSYRITAEQCIKSNLNGKSKTDEECNEEEFTIKIQLSDSR